MKQQYTIKRDDDKNIITIEEHAELDKGILTMICAKTFTKGDIISAIDNSQQALIDFFRSVNFFPPTFHAEKIAGAVTELCTQDEIMAVDVKINDKEMITPIEQALPVVDDIEDDLENDETDELDGLLEDDNEIKIIK